jgi:hypothetical protein
MSSPSKVAAAAARMGVAVDESDGFVVLDAPAGLVFRANGEHTFVCSFTDGRRAGWEDALEVLRMALEPCSPINEPECAYCDGELGDAYRFDRSEVTA